ncbi:MAG: hypothetical protein ABSF16_01775 [Terracidiphilus sp.]|jgi:hypothetical protein
MKRPLSSFLSTRLCMLVALTAMIAAAHACYGTTPKTLCSVTDYKIFNPSSVAIQCGDATSTAGISGQGGAVYLGTDLSSPLPVTFTANPYDDNWLFLVFTPKSGPVAPILKTQTKYTITITLSSTVNGVVLSLPTSTLIDTTPTLTLAALPVGGPNNYLVSSHLAFQGLGLGSGKTLSCSLVIQNYTGTFTARPAKCRQMQADLAGVQPNQPDPGTVGTLELQTEGNDIDIQGIPYKIAELQNVLGTAMTLDPKARLGQEKAPATKDASSYYINGSFAAGRGSKPGWILDAKIAPPVGRLYGGWQFCPTALANVGNNSISGMTYTDTIDFGLSESRPFELRGNLQEIYASGSVVYETDKEFNRDNVTGVADFRYNFKNLYSPRAVETLRKFGDQQKIAKANGITLQQSDVSPPFFGYAFDIHTGVEFGGAVVDTTVKATTGKATIELPTYSIFRVVPQIHGLLEFGRLSVDAVGTPRYLAATENTVVQLPNNSLILKTVHGWNGYGVVTSALNLDSVGHFCLSATYRDGFAPPKFSRINTVQLGILMKF